MADPSLVPLKPADAKKLARDIVENGMVAFSSHALDEMAKDDLEATDCVNLLRGGVFHSPELIKQEWRYRAMTPRICVVIAFLSETQLRLVMAWRIEQ